MAQMNKYPSDYTKQNISILQYLCAALLPSAQTKFVGTPSNPVYVKWKMLFHADHKQNEDMVPDTFW